jgi:hypothetical protein
LQVLVGDGVKRVDCCCLAQCLCELRVPFEDDPDIVFADDCHVTFFSGVDIELLDFSTWQVEKVEMTNSVSLL